MCDRDLTDPFPAPVFSYPPVTGTTPSSRLISVADWAPVALTFTVRHVDGRPLTGARLKAFNVTTSVYYPIGGFAAGPCFRAMPDPDHWANVDSAGEVTLLAPPGFFIFTVAKDVQGGEATWFQKAQLISGPTQVTLQADVATRIEPLIDGQPLASFSVEVSSASRKPGFHPARLGVSSGAFTLETSAQSKVSLRLVQHPQGAQPGTIVLADLNLGCGHTSIQVPRARAEMARVTFRALGQNSTPENIGRVDLNFHDFYMGNFAVALAVDGVTTFDIDPTSIGRLHVLTKAGYYFAFIPSSGYVAPLAGGGQYTFSAGGPFDVQLRAHTFNPPQYAQRNCFWFQVKDSFGNLLDFYTKPGLAAPPQVTVRRAGTVVFDQPLSGGPFHINTDTRNTVYLDPPAEHLVTFAESLGPFGAVSLVNQPMDQIGIPLIAFESANFDFVLPQEVSSLRTDFQTRFDPFYEGIATFFGVRTTQKIPVRTIVTDGADISWAPLGGPTRALTCQSSSYGCWNYLTHEIGHPFTANAPISANGSVNPSHGVYNEESKAAYISVIAVSAMRDTMGENLRGGSPSDFRRLVDSSTCRDLNESVQNLMLYLDRRYPGRKPNVELIVGWNLRHAPQYAQLVGAGFSRDEAFAALYSKVVGDNLGPLWELLGLAQSSRVTQALAALRL